MRLLLAVALKMVPAALLNGPALGMVAVDAVEVARVVPLSFFAVTVQV
jgi:hypothetical protein